MDFKRIILSGLIAGLAAFIVGSILYMNPLFSSFYASATTGCSKSMDLFGGTMNWLVFMWAGGMVSAVFLAALYSYTEKGLKGAVWKKGLFFGILMWLVAGLPTAYNTWLLHNYPDSLILIELFNGLIGGLVGGIVLAVAYEKLK
jgi:hypothetical protein